MARHRRFNLEFKQQVVLDFLERRMVFANWRASIICRATCSANGYASTNPDS